MQTFIDGWVSIEIPSHHKIDAMLAIDAQNKTALLSQCVCVCVADRQAL